MSTKKTRVLVWDENPPHAPKALYPHNIRGAIADGLREMGGELLDVHTGHLDEPYQGIASGLLHDMDVLVWWGHVRHREVDDTLAQHIAERIWHHGLGFVALHSAHYAKPFRTVLRCTGHLKGGWREDDQPEEIRVCAPHHPITHGVRDFTLAKEEMYGAPFDVPTPEVVVLQSFFPAGGEYFPSGIAWTVGDGIDPKFESGPGGGTGQGEGAGRVFYFRPGHETVPTYFNMDVRRVIYNAVRWAGKADTAAR